MECNCYNRCQVVQTICNWLPTIRTEIIYVHIGQQVKNRQLIPTCANRRTFTCTFIYLVVLCQPTPITLGTNYSTNMQSSYYGQPYNYSYPWVSVPGGMSASSYTSNVPYGPGFPFYWGDVHVGSFDWSRATPHRQTTTPAANISTTHDVQTSSSNTIQTVQQSETTGSDSTVTLDEEFGDNLIDMYLATSNKCRLSKAEAMIAQALKRIFPGASFEKVRPSFLLNPRSNRKLELDLFCESLKLGIERSGLQHFVFPNGLHANRAVFEALQERDKLKVELCRKAGITLVHVPFTVSAKETESYLRDELRRLNFNVSADSSKPSSPVA